ncbi:MAG: hypothetical protein NW237_04580 [Cyanobacteriota bacterium]|nr:hypothetical protein [Cyanobacteriota bacterium]
MRYFMSMAQDPISSLTFSLLGVTSDQAHVDLTDEKLIVKAGNLFSETFALNQLGRAERLSWEWYMGLGIRTDFQGKVGIVTNWENVIGIPLLSSQTLFIPILGALGLQVPCQQIIFSLKDADTFLTNFNQGRASSSGPTGIAID